MRPRHMISIAFAAILFGMGLWSFYSNVVDPHRSGNPMKGVAMGGVDTEATPGGTAAPVEDGGDDAAGAGQIASTGVSLVPSSLGGWPLWASAEGDEARAQVERLHGGDLGSGLEGAWVAQYGSSTSGQAKVSLWITRALVSSDARGLYERMTARISKGNSPFTGLRPIGTAGVEGYALEGMGQRHFYFLEGSDLYWLSVDLAHAEAVLAELLANARRAARG